MKRTIALNTQKNIKTEDLSKKIAEMQEVLDAQNKNIKDKEALEKELELVKKNIKNKRQEEKEILEKIDLLNIELSELEKKIFYANEQVEKGERFLIDFQKQIYELKETAQKNYELGVKKLESDKILEEEKLNKKIEAVSKKLIDKERELYEIKERLNNLYSEEELLKSSIVILKNEESELILLTENKRDIYEKEKIKELRLLEEIKKKEKVVQEIKELEEKIKEKEKELKKKGRELEEIAEREVNVCERERVYEERRRQLIESVNQLCDVFDKPEARRILNKLLNGWS